MGRMQSLGLQAQTNANLLNLTQDAVKTSEIEGEVVDVDQVRSSLARRLGLQRGGLPPTERKAEAIATVVHDATQNYRQPLTEERLFRWHRALFPFGDRARPPIATGAWRTDEFDPMVVASGPPDRERVHFEAPVADRVSREMQVFLAWFEADHPRIDPVLKAAVAHLHFVTIHPFHDGNGRIGRAITDMALARAEGTSQRCYSMSSRLRRERGEYYETLEAMQKGDLDITSRLAWFLRTLDQALADAEQTLDGTIRKVRFWDTIAGVPLNERQRMMLSRLVDGFVGKLTTAKWAQIAKCSSDTALRDIAGLMAHGVLRQDTAGGRSTSYVFVDGP